MRSAFSPAVPGPLVAAALPAAGTSPRRHEKSADHMPYGRFVSMAAFLGYELGMNVRGDSSAVRRGEASEPLRAATAAA